MRGCSKDSNPESQCLDIHPAPCYPNPICAFTSEDNKMRHPNLSFVGNSLELERRHLFSLFPNSSHPWKHWQTLHFAVVSNPSGLGRFLFSAFLWKTSRKVRFFPSWMPSLVCSPDPKTLNGFLALGSWISWLCSRRKGHQAAGHCSVWRAWMMKSLLPEKEIY